MSSAIPRSLMLLLWVLLWPGCVSDSSAPSEARTPCDRAEDVEAVRKLVHRWFIKFSGRTQMRDIGIDPEMTPRERLRWQHCSLDRAAERVLAGLQELCPRRSVPEGEVQAWVRDEFRRCQPD